LNNKQGILSMIVVFGSLNIDMVLSVPVIPRPGETVLCPDYKLFPGGKGANQAVAAVRAGAQVYMYGAIGNDDFGRRVYDSLIEAKVDCSGIVKSDVSTGCAMICVDKAGENMITVASGANRLATADDVPAKALTKDSTLVLQMEVLAEENWKLIRRAKAKGARVILNLAPAQAVPEDILKCLDILVMNEIEASLLAMYLGFDGSYPRAIARRLTDLYGLTVIVTLGAEGAYASSQKGNCNVEAMKVNAVDTTAAGDAFVGVLAVSLDQGHNLPASLHRASVASGLTCMREGAQPSLPYLQEIETAMQEIPSPKLVA
jgi:ribokinase